MSIEQDNRNDYLLFNCAWCCPPEKKNLQPTLPGFNITDGICHEHQLLVFLRSGMLPQYLEKEHTTVEDLLTRYIARQLNDSLIESGIK